MIVDELDPVVQELLKVSHKAKNGYEYIEELQVLLDYLDKKFFDDQIWDLIKNFVRLHETSDRVRAFSLVLDHMNPKRLSGIVSNQYTDREIKVYWFLFSKDLRKELIRLGRGPIGDNSSFNKESHRKKKQKIRKYPVIVRRTLKMMIRTFGFNESMSYKEAQRLYWQLASKLHPDRIGDNPEIRELNNAWETTKIFFMENA